MRSALETLVLPLLLGSSLVAAATAVPARLDLAAPDPLLRPGDPYHDAGGDSAPAKKTDRMRDDRQGIFIDETRSDWQYREPGNSRIALDASGTVQMCYTTGWNVTSYSAMVVCIDPEMPIIPLPIAGFHSRRPSLVVSGPDPDQLPANCAVFALCGQDGIWYGNDFSSCALAFVLYGPAGELLHPGIALDDDEQQHITAGSFEPLDMYYNSPPWGEWIPLGNQRTTERAVICAAGEDPGVAAAAATPAQCLDPLFEGLLRAYDVLWVRAEDNDLRQRIMNDEIENLTRYGCADTPAPYAYHTAATGDLELLYDRQEPHQLHLLYTAAIIFLDSMLYQVNGTVYHQEFVQSSRRSAVWHQNLDTGEWGHVAGWLTGEGEDHREAYPGCVRFCDDHPQLSVETESGSLYCLWNHFDTTDEAAEWGEHRMANGEIYGACSVDGGRTWGSRVNLTGTATPDCESPDCLSETDHSLTELADDHVHFSFLQDLHAGNMVYGESEETLNPIEYKRVPRDTIPPPEDGGWNAAGHVGLFPYLRPWHFQDGHPDTVKVIDRTAVFNEGEQALQLDELVMYHDELDDFDGPDLSVGWDVWTGESYVADPADSLDWPGVLPGWSATQMRIRVQHRGLPLLEQAFQFRFSDGTVRNYRYTYRAGDGETSLVEEIDLQNLDLYEERQLYDRVFSGIGEYSGPLAFSLEQNHPNPFNPRTEIVFSLRTGGPASLKVYDLLGRQVAVLAEGRLGAGEHSVTFEGGELASGVYFFVLSCREFSQSRKMLLIR